MAIKGLAGNEMAQPRVFAHDALGITADAAQIAGTENRGVCLYIGGAGTNGTAVVKMESGNIAVFKGLSAGSFLPILVTHLLVNNGAGVSTDVTDVLALY